MAWLKRVVFLEDGVSWKLEKYKEVPDGSIFILKTQSYDDWMDENCPTKNWREYVS